MLVAIRPGGTGNVTDTHVKWELNRGIPEIPSPIFHRDRIYMVRSGGVLTAVNAITGKIIYRDRLEGLGHYRASPIIAGDHLYFASEAGAITVVKTGDEMDIVNQYELGEPVMVTPALDSDTLYVRGEKNLWAFRE